MGPNYYLVSYSMGLLKGAIVNNMFEKVTIKSEGQSRRKTVGVRLSIYALKF